MENQQGLFCEDQEVLSEISWNELLKVVRKED